MRQTTIVIMPGDGVAPSTPMARRRELMLACSALIGILMIGAGTWVASPAESGEPLSSARESVDGPISEK